MHKRILACVAILTASSSLVLAAANPADYNGDGRISREEFRNQAAKAVFGADKNSDGAIDDGEMKLPEDVRKKLDANGDGKVSPEELIDGQMAGFAELDKNGDGALDQGEMGGSN